MLGAPAEALDGHALDAAHPVDPCVLALASSRCYYSVAERESFRAARAREPAEDARSGQRQSSSARGVGTPRGITAASALDAVSLAAAHALAEQVARRFYKKGFSAHTRHETS